MKKTTFISSLVVSTIAMAAFAAEPAKKTFTVEDMWEMERIADPVISPDGKNVMYSIKTYSMALNRGATDIWMTSLDGKTTKPVIQSAGPDDSAVFSPDGTKVYFLSSRSGSSQVWEVSVKGSVPYQITNFPTDVNGFKLFPDGKTFLISADVFPESKSFEESNQIEKNISKRQGNYKIYDQLLFRHWDTWEDGKRGHLFVFKSGQKPIDLMQGLDMDAPTHPFGGLEETAISPDGKYVVFAARSDGNKAAWTYNVDLFSVSTNGKEKPQNITAANVAYDNIPAFSPDGKTLAYLSMKTPGYESDRQRIVLMDWATKKTTVLTEAWDRSPSEINWSTDGKTIYTTADHIGNVAIFAVDVATGNAKVLADKGTNAHPVQVGDSIVFMRDTLKSPVEIWSMNKDGSSPRQISNVNTDRVNKIAWADYEQFSFAGDKGEKVYGYVMKPANWDGKSKAPVAFLIHGGPQTSFADHFHYRWNPEIYAAQGYAVVFIDFHGSPGYGQKFTDSIQGNWGGSPYIDLMKGLDYAISKYAYLDSKNLFALGASYGGYMINWINGQTDRFKALVAHDGNIDEYMGYYDTEELWFPERDHKGLPWEHPENYQRQSPINFIKNWKTPTLIIHGGRDYRVVETQGMAAFTALQRRGIKSRFLYFPEQNHWVLKAQDSLVWHREVFRWLSEFK